MMATLKDICKLKVIERGISRAQLPSTISKEIELMEEQIKSVFTGKFSLVGYGLDSLKIGWVGGEWHFTLLNLQTIKISGGGSNCLGLPGGRLFFFPGVLQLMISRLICWEERSSSMERALPPKILQEEHSSLVYVLLRIPFWASWKVRSLLGKVRKFQEGF